MADLPNSGDSIETKMLAFVYPEVKDLSKHFLTLVSGVLVFSVTFSEKIVNFSGASLGAKWLLFGSWTMFILALVTVGIAIWLNYVAATSALRGKATDIAQMVPRIYVILNLGGVGFVIGLVLLAMTALSRIMG